MFKARGTALRRVLAAGTAAFAAPAALAFNFNLMGGALDGAFDTDVTYGVQVRTQDASIRNRAYGNSVLFPDAGDVVSNQLRASHTLELRWGRFGVLGRGNYFVDFEQIQQDLPPASESPAEGQGVITDAYAWGYFGPNEEVTVRLGQQVISWGENTFIQGALADINTVDLTKLRAPGSNLKDAFVGTPAAYASWNFLDNWTLEGFYLFRFDEIKLDPVGSFFTTSDFITEGGGYDGQGDGVLDFGTVRADLGGIPGGCLPPAQPNDGGAPVRCDVFGGGLVRGPDQFPGGGQWGIALRRFFPTLLNGSEIGLYFERLHDHLPAVSTYAGSGQFFLDYPKAIERYGISFNTNFRGYAIAGEFSYRDGAPIQLTLPILQGLRALPPFAPVPALPPGTRVQGFDRIDRYQFQFTVQRIWGPWQFIGAEQSSSILEVAYGHIGGLPDLKLLFPGAPGIFGRLTNLFEPDISEDFWGFQFRHSLTYEAALFNLIQADPFLAFRWDVHGYSNEIGGAKLFVEGRKALTLGVNFNYQGGKYRAGVSWTGFMGPTHKTNLAGSRLNGTTDRDFLQVNLSMSF